MIPWVKYDPENPPELGKEYLLLANGYVRSGSLLAHDGIEWYCSVVGNRIHNVTHYAEITLPERELPPHFKDMTWFTPESEGEK
ncbi:hypothetical protein [Paenibacillus macerans]|uniref:hypothetical protein n=1 Tax=Paenibacillus macerans TaxID=44252 RepID=UPI00203B363C|nr:hypothetical protein [Paenibacillus macerans]MCM3703826.1 hypothetical protein [Paenibacillus macerans]